MRSGGLSALMIVVLVAIGVWATPRANAHAELERSSPAADSVLAAPPQRVDLWLTEAVAAGAGSPELSVLDEAGKELGVSNLEIDVSDPRHVTATLNGAGFGTFTVLWSARSDTDGHTLTGSFAFRVGGTSRAPGAATVEGETPRVWAVATRWIAFLAAAIAAGGFAAGVLVFGLVSEERDSRRRRNLLILVVSITGIIATAIEPFLQTRFPPSGALAPSLRDAFNGLPDAWFLRIPGFILVWLVAAHLLVRGYGRRAAWFTWAGVAGGLVAILGLALTSHAAAREAWRLPATVSVVIHQWSVGLWAGGLIHLLIARPFERQSDARTPIQRFSFWALFLAIAGILTGIINAGFVLPAFKALWSSDYGRALIAKIIVLLPVLLLATFHRLTLRRSIERAATMFKRSLRLETVLVTIVVLGGSVLALLAPPSVAKHAMTALDLAAPLTSDARGEYVRLQIAPAATGENRLAVVVTNGIPISYGDGGVLVDAPAVTDIALVRVTMTSLVHESAVTEIELAAEGTGWFRSSRLQLGLDGWWRADVLVRRAGVEDAIVPFYVLLPDPNVNGESAVRVPASSEEAMAVFQTGLTGLTSLHSVHFTERLSGGTGTSLISDHITHDGTGGQPAAMRIATSDSAVIRTGGYQWVQNGAGDWTKTDANDVVPPSEWGSDYTNATGFRLGATATIGDRTARIVTFYVPGDTFASAWYAWWVDVETGRLLQETMVSRGHYMLRTFDAFDSAPPVTAPAD